MLFRSRVVVAPIDQGGRAAIELVQAPDPIGDGNVFGFEQGGQPGMHFLEVLQYGPIAGHATQASLPSVHVGVDQAWDHDHATTVHALGIGDFDSGGYARNAITFNQQVSLLKISQFGIHGDQGGLFNERLGHLINLPSAHGIVKATGGKQG